MIYEKDINFKENHHGEGAIITNSYLVNHHGGGAVINNGISSANNNITRDRDMKYKQMITSNIFLTTEPPSYTLIFSNFEKSYF